MSHRPLRSTLIAALIGTGLVSAGAVYAQAAAIYCCNDASGRKVCADFLPPECAKRAFEERDAKGFVIKKVEAPLSPEQQAKRDAELAKKAEVDRLKAEERRRDLALLQTYVDENDIDRARDLALADVDKLVVQAEKGLNDALQRQKKVAKEKEFYKDKALPAALKDQLANADKDVNNKTLAVEERRAEKVKIGTRYEAEKRKYRDLKTGKEPAAKSVEPEKTKREVVVQPNEGAAAENRSGPAMTTPASPPAPTAPAVGSKGEA